MSRRTANNALMIDRTISKSDKQFHKQSTPMGLCIYTVFR